MPSNNIMGEDLDNIEAKKNSIVLIGMPGAGKTTIAPLLAEKLGWSLIDTDDNIETAACKSCQEIVNQHGYLYFRNIEEKELISINLENHVIATGGSAVYSSAGMSHLKSRSMVIFMQISFEGLLDRQLDIKNRGIASKTGQTFHETYLERQSLYQKYADCTVECSGKSREQVLNEILDLIEC